MPYCYLGSSIKYQGHMGWKIDDLNPVWVRLLGRSQLSNPSDLPCFVSTHTNIMQISITLRPHPLPTRCNDNVIITSKPRRRRFDVMIMLLSFQLQVSDEFSSRVGSCTYHSSTLTWHSWSPSSCKTRTCLFYKDNIMGTDVLATLEASQGINNHAID